MTNGFSKRLDDIPKSGIREFFDYVSESDDIISLGVGEPDFLTPWFIREEAIYAIEKGLTTYTSNKGLYDLRVAISAHQKNHFGVTYDPEDEILVTNGVSEGADIVLRALLNPGDEVILPKPMYVCYDPLITLAGGKVISINTSQTGFVPDPKEIEKKINAKTKAIVLCYPHNPTGMSISKKVLQEIAKIAEKHDLWVISDEIYAELTFKGRFVSFSSLPKMKKRTILLNGFSKAYAMTGWRVGYICAPKKLISRALKIHQYSAMCVSTPSQYAALEAIKTGQNDVIRMRDSYKQRANMFVEGLNKIGLKTLEPDGSLYCFPSIEITGLDAMTFAKKLLKQYQVAVVPGTAFGDEGEGFVRCCFATKQSDLKKSLKRIADFVSQWI